MTMPSIREPELEEDEWDPQGLNAMSFENDEEGDEEDEEEEVSADDEEGLDAVVVLADEDEDEETESDSVGLDVDGLTELEQMERSLLQEESLDFAMIGEEE